MHPVKIGSPVARVYRINSVLKIVWSSTEMLVTHNNVRPYFTNTAGPRRNSPDPIETPSTMTPGPTAASHPNPCGRGASGRFAGFHAGNPERLSVAGVDGFMRSAENTSDPRSRSSTVLYWRERAIAEVCGRACAPCSVEAASDRLAISPSRDTTRAGDSAVRRFAR